MNNKYIQQVLEIEKKSQEIHEKAKREAQQLPILAEQEAQALIAKANESGASSHDAYKARQHERVRMRLFRDKDDPLPPD
jgi:hypothetical protein